MNLISQEQNGLTPYIVKEVNKILKAHKNDPTQLVGILLDIQNFTERHYTAARSGIYLKKTRNTFNKSFRRNIFL